MRMTDKRGISLVEVAIAIMVSSMVIVGILALYYQSVRGIKQMNQVFVASNLAKSRLERLNNFEFNSLPLAEETDTPIDKEGNPDLNGDFKRNTSVTSNYNGRANLTQVTVTVDYKIKGEFSGKPVPLTTVYVEE